MWKRVVKAFEVLREAVRALEKRHAERASTVPPAPTQPHHRHQWNWYAGWTPGREPFERLEKPECAYCGTPQTDRNRLERCQFFG